MTATLDVNQARKRLEAWTDAPLLEFPELLEDLVIVALNPPFALFLADPEPTRAVGLAECRRGRYKLDANLNIFVPLEGLGRAPASVGARSRRRRGTNTYLVQLV